MFVSSLLFKSLSPISRIPISRISRTIFLPHTQKSTMQTEIELLRFLADGATDTIQLESVPRESVLENLASQCTSFTLLGNSDKDYAEIKQWTNYALDNLGEGKTDPSVFKNVAKFLNDALKTQTYIAANQLTLADLLLYVRLHTFVKDMTEKRRFDLCNLVRWFDFVQHHSGISDFPGLELVSFNLDAPTVKDAQEEPPKGKAPNDTSGTKDSSTPKEKEKKKKKDKEKPKKEAAAQEPEKAANDPSRLDIRVGQIVDVKQHENADSLYVEQINVGEEQPRTIVSGLVKHIPIEEMRERLVVVLCNLKPANMRGIKSAGMVLAATGEDGKVELLSPPKMSKPGDRVVFAGFEEGEPDAVLNPKKKVWETIQPGLRTTEALKAVYCPETGEHGMVLKSTKEEIVVTSVAKATIK